MKLETIASKNYTTTCAPLNAVWTISSSSTFGWSKKLFHLVYLSLPPYPNVSHLIPSLSSQNASNQPNRGQFSGLTIIEKGQFMASKIMRRTNFILNTFSDNRP